MTTWDSVIEVKALTPSNKYNHVSSINLEAVIHLAQVSISFFGETRRQLPHVAHAWHHSAERQPMQQYLGGPTAGIQDGEVLTSR